MFLLYLHSISVGLNGNLDEVLDVHTLLESQVLDTVSYSELLALMVKIPVCCSLNSSLISILRQAHILQPLVDIEAKVPLLVKVLAPLGYELLLCMLSLSSKFDECAREKLEHVVFDRLLSRLSRSDRQKTLY
jgi:hypothetical protein